MTNIFADDGATDRLVDPTGGPDAESLLPVDETDLETLRARLSRVAEDDGLLDVAYRAIDTPVGRLLLAATDRGLVRVAYEREGFDTVLATLADRIGPRILPDATRLDQTARELAEYFAGSRHEFDVPLDHRLSAGFRQAVQHYLPSIGYGSTLTYRQVAEQVGNPKAVRAVGSACATNPLPVIVPCHRVLRTGGGLGGYIGGLDAKATLLALEHAA